MKLELFNKNHIYEAIELVHDNYEEEQKCNSALPDLVQIPDLTIFAQNGLGAAAMEGNRLVGFLSAYPPVGNAFGTTGLRGTFSPIHAHAVARGKVLTQMGCERNYSRRRIYSLLYQAAAQQWLKEGILTHAIALFANDDEAVNSFFYNGFGLRCMDAIRSLDTIPKPINTNDKSERVLEYTEVLREDWSKLLNYHNDLIKHLGKSPAFLSYYPMDEKELYRRTSPDVRYFAAKADGRYAAYIKIADHGENYVTENAGMINICGAYCDPVYRGTGMYHNLLCYLMATLKKEGYQLLGVDFESFNPTALGFWLKNFEAYTKSVVRQIDQIQLTS